MIGPGRPGQPGVHHRTHPGHGQARLGHRRRQHDPPPRPGGQRQVLLGGAQPAVQLEHVDAGQIRVSEQGGRAADLRHAG